MPNAYLQKISETHGISIEKTEDLWMKARGIASKAGHSGNYAYQTGVFKKMLGEKLTMQEMVMMKEYAWETNFFVPKSLSKLLNKILKNKNLKAAIEQYMEFTNKGMKHGVAVHKAASMYGFDDDRMFGDLITKLQKNGLLEDSELNDMFFRLLEDSGAVSVEAFVTQFFNEEGEPTNTSKGVAPDRDHVNDKKAIAKRKKAKKRVDDIDDGKDPDGEKMKESNSYANLINVISEGKQPKMLPAAKRKFQKEVAKIMKTSYYSSVTDPINDADDALMKLGYKLVNEDGTDFGGFFTGANGRASIDIGDSKGVMLDNYLQVQWHKMPSGKYEVNMYLS